MADDSVWTPDDYDAEIHRLEAERDELRAKLDDHEEQENRRQRRAQLLGDWATTRFTWPPNQLAELRTAAGDEKWLFDLKLLKLDGWTLDDKGHWKAPKAPTADQAVPTPGEP